MKKIFAVLVMVFLFSVTAFADELILKLNLAHERVMRIQAELSLMKSQYQRGQESLHLAIKDFQELDAKVKALKDTKAEKKK